MFGIGLPELFLILALALIVLGPDKLPETARKIAKIVGDLRRTTEEFKRELELEALNDLKELKRPDYLLDKFTVPPEAKAGSEADQMRAVSDVPEEPEGTVEPQFSTVGPGWKEAASGRSGTDKTDSKGDPQRSNVH